MKPGYKQTEVGVIPEEWETRPCSELSERIMVGIVIRPTQYYVRHGVPAFRSANIREDGITDSDLVFISDASNALLAKSQTRTGDVLTVRTGYPGTSAVVRPAHAGCNCIDILITRPSQKIDSDWLAIWINSPFGKEQVLRNQGGLAQKHFNVGDMRNLVVALPPLPEQRAIATALSDVDGLLGALDRLIAKKRDLKQAAMQQLLTGQTRLPGFKGEWVVKTLKSIVQSPVTDGPHLTPQFLDDGIPFLSVNNLVGNKIDLADLRFISQADHEVFSRKCKPRKGDILLGKAASVGKVALVEFDIDFNIWSPIALIRVNTENSPRFVYYQLQGAALIGQITLLTNSSSQGNIGMGDIEKLTLNLPPLPEQTAIATLLSDMDMELAGLEQRREKTRALKQGMMQELLTGRTRLL